jgi:multicomponent Na+:H+ antiporter subunit G
VSPLDALRAGADIAGTVLVLAGVGFFLAGTIGLLRFPDVHTRLHALTKADGAGLGLVVAGLALRSPDLAVAAKLLLIWGLALAASATSAYLIAYRAPHGLREEADDGR